MKSPESGVRSLGHERAWAPAVDHASDAPHQYPHRPGSLPALTRNCDGIALLELLTALVIVSTGLFGVIQMYQVGIARMQEAQHMALAMRLIDNELETLRSAPYDALHEGRDIPWISEPNDLDVLPEAAGSVEITPLVGHDRIQQVTVRLRWREGRRTIHREVVTLIGEAP